MLEWRSAMNLLIVDDEYLVVEEVVTVTDWELLGITEIYSATNAVSAVRILNEKKRYSLYIFKRSNDTKFTNYNK